MLFPTETLRPGLSTITPVVVALTAFSLVASNGAARVAGDAELNAAGLPVKTADGKPVLYEMGDLKENTIAPSSLQPTAAPVERGQDTSIPEFKATWVYPFFGSGLGLNLWAGKTDAGKAEIYVGSGPSTFGSNGYWMALAYDPVSKTYNPFFSSEYFSDGLKTITVADVTGGPGKEIIVATATGRILIYDQATKKLIKTFTQPGGSLTGLRTANLDGTGNAEIITCNEGMTYAFADGVLLWSVVAGGDDLAVAQMDNDPALEIAVSSGKVIDSETRQVQWNRGSAFGRRLQAADIDQDGKAELVSAEAWYYVWAFDIDTELPKWSFKTDHDVNALQITDIDGNGTVEIAIGDGQWGKVYGINPMTRAVEYSIANPEHGVANIAAADVDGDGAQELIWGAGFSSTGKDALYVANPVTSVIEWQSIHLDGPVVGPEVGDLDGDNKDELVAASWESESGYSSARILVFDNKTLALRGISAPICDGRAWQGLNDLKLRDIDGDGNLEIIVAAGYLYDGVIEAYDFNSSNAFVKSWTNNVRPNGEPYSSVEVADVDNDGQPEILAGNTRAHTGSAGTFLRVLDYASKNVEWTSFHLGGTWQGVVDVAAADVDTSAGLEMLALVGAGNLYIFDGITKDPKAIVNGPFTHMRVSGKNIFLSDATGKISRYNFSAGKYTLTESTQVANGSIDGFNIINPSLQAFTFGKDGRLNVFVGGAVRSRSADYGAPYGRNVVNGATGGKYCLGVHRAHIPPVMHPEPLETSGTENVVSWDYTEGAIGYVVEASTNPDFTGSESAVTYDTNYEFSALEVDQTYYFRVKAMYLDGSTESVWSGTESSEQVPVQASATSWELYS